jgi:hypothetical protein
MSAWVQHCKNYQQQNGCSYKDALKGAKATYQKGGARKIAPTLVSAEAEPSGASVFNPPEEKLVQGSDEWQKKKDDNSVQYLEDLVKRIELGEGDYGKKKYQKEYKVGDITKLAKKKKSGEVNKKKTNKNSLDAKIKRQENKWANLLQSNQGVTACKPNETEIKAHCRKKKVR